MSTTQEQAELAVHNAILEALPSWVFLIEASQDEYDEMAAEATDAGFFAGQMTYVIQISFTDPAKWSDPAPFLYTEDEGGVVTFETYEAAESFARILFGKNRDVTTKVIGYEEATK